MATILTVHGTNASGPAEGEHWWQRGSPFEKHMREFVEGSDGRLEMVPVLWDGANSELSRQGAGSALLKELATLEAKKEPYCIIGHSHGGSIIATALIEAAHSNRPLNSLSRWITVGTPFVASKRKRLLFSHGLLQGAAVPKAAGLFDRPVRWVPSNSSIPERSGLPAGQVMVRRLAARLRGAKPASRLVADRPNHCKPWRQPAEAAGEPMMSASRCRVVSSRLGAPASRMSRAGSSATRICATAGVTCPVCGHDARC